MNEDDTLPPNYRRIEREKLRPYIIVAWIVGLVAFAFMVAGCTALPRCPDASFVQIDRGGERYTVFDSRNWALAMETLRGLALGTCAIDIPKPSGGTGPTSST